MPLVLLSFGRLAGPAASAVDQQPFCASTGHEDCTPAAHSCQRAAEVSLTSACRCHEVPAYRQTACQIVRSERWTWTPLGMLQVLMPDHARPSQSPQATNLLLACSLINSCSS